MVGVVESERDLRDCETAADFGMHGDLLQAHRRVAGCCDHQLRTRYALDRHRSQILRAGCQSQPRASQQKKELGNPLFTCA